MRLAEGIGVEGARDALTDDKNMADVEADIREARLLRATGVPFFVLDRKCGVSGAQSVEVFASGLRQAQEAV